MMIWHEGSNKYVFPCLFVCLKSYELRSCRCRAVRASDFHAGDPRFEPRPGSSAPWARRFILIAYSLSEETLSRRSRV